MTKIVQRQRCGGVCEMSGETSKWCTGNVRWAREIYSVLNSNVGGVGRNSGEFPANFAITAIKCDSRVLGRPPIQEHR